MDPHIEGLLEKYQAKGVLIDTNLLLLLTIGIYRKDRIQTFKRTHQYTVNDFQLVMGIADRFHRRVTTPNILTETDNLARQLPANEHSKVAATLTRLVADMFEQYESSSAVVQQTTYSRLGLADCVTLSFARDLLVLTDDARLFSFLASFGRDAININHIRTLD